MINLFWAAAALLGILIAFRIYLQATDQYISFHAQNLSEKTPKAPMWRHGRCWWNLYFRDDHKNVRYPSPGVRLEWSCFGYSSTAIGFDLAADEDDFQIHAAIYKLFSFWLTFQGLPFLDRLFRDVRMGFGYETAVKWMVGALYIYVIHNEMWGAGTVKWKWMPRWISIWKATGYQEYPGVGFYVCFNFDRLIYGSYERTEENIGEPIVMEIPIEPDNSLGLRYYATFQRQVETRWRGNFPWRKKVNEYWEVSTDNPPLHAGKGENSWDLDDDGILGCSVTAVTVEEAVQKYVELCQRDRKKYGLPNVVEKLITETGWTS